MNYLTTDTDLTAVADAIRAKVGVQGALMYPDDYIDFYVEKPLDNNSKQRFDFYLENINHKIAIEYNGMQHYKETDFFVSDLKTFQERDKRKAEYCKQNNIELYIIPYTYSENEIKETLLKIIDKFND